MKDEPSNDKATLTMNSVALMVSGFIYVPDPPGSYAMDPDEPLALLDLLKPALEACGLSDRLDDVYLACRAAAESHFVKTIAELEALRVRVLSEQ